ncbi:hypothetical protein PQX77_013776, partial [Marasmius sp. AFHP31]
REAVTNMPTSFLSSNAAPFGIRRAETVRYLLTVKQDGSSGKKKNFESKNAYYLRDSWDTMPNSALLNNVSGPNGLAMA